MSKQALLILWVLCTLAISAWLYSEQLVPDEDQYKMAAGAALLALVPTGILAALAKK